MISQQVLELERAILALNLEEQQWLLERITRQVLQKTGVNQFANSSYIEAQIEAMANDPQIQAEISAIDREFAVTEMDGLEVEAAIRYCLGL